MRKALHFGAGNIGRGFIGAVLSEADFNVQFADVNERVINELNDKKQYTVQIASHEQASFEVIGVSGINSLSDREELIKAVANADLITASVGPSVLSIIAKDIAAGLTYASEQNILKEMNIVACENMINATDFLKAEIDKHVSDDVKNKIDASVGFPNSAVDRIVPIQHHEDALTVQVEPFFEWVIEEGSWRGAVPEMEGVQFVADLSPFIERKLLTVNTGHASIAYLGLRQGFVTVDKAIEDSEIKQKVEKALEETSQFLIKKYNLDQVEHQSYVQKIIERFENPYLSDELSRVGRAPLRKLGKRERLVYPAHSLMQEGTVPQALIETIASALHFEQESDEESQSLQQKMNELGAKRTFAQISGLEENDPLVLAVADQYQKQK
ncbi:mannitol-1-phosphate 5-dehydrogenase [Jeotgalibacillus sp. S-D1]|uniref:mannitol-1-phosphate 5-dehydrogenase n=1 Tax=Jeotgalibacillus sp. S-D1 TaxID=2552189 RepID=UPI00105A3D40|nr:mannitol-1-phosphate 5-dehydrogenase [Jeotgalibacillus sp. S-D1]TDL30465.1 mannitol-1-phosphate 5-dehydrogenase [Jeotgalibacillus sp. S-D1]